MQEGLSNNCCNIPYIIDNTFQKHYCQNCLERVWIYCILVGKHFGLPPEMRRCILQMCQKGTVVNPMWEHLESYVESTPRPITIMGALYVKIFVKKKEFITKHAHQIKSDQEDETGYLGTAHMHAGYFIMIDIFVDPNLNVCVKIK